MKLFLDGTSDFERAARLACWLNRPAVSAVVLASPPVDRRERARLETAIKGYFNDCGCRWATGAFLAALLWALLASPWQASPPWMAAANTMLFSVAAALGGKIGGLSWSWWRLRTLLGHLKRGAASWH